MTLTLGETAGRDQEEDRNRTFLIRPGNLPPDLKRDAGLAGDVQQFINHRLEQRDAFFAADRFGFALGIAGDQRAVGAGGGFGFSKKGVKSVVGVLRLLSHLIPATPDSAVLQL